MISITDNNTYSDYMSSIHIMHYIFEIIMISDYIISDTTSYILQHIVTTKLQVMYHKLCITTLYNFGYYKLSGE